MPERPRRARRTRLRCRARARASKIRSAARDRRSTRTRGPIGSRSSERLNDRPRRRSPPRCTGEQSRYSPNVRACASFSHRKRRRPARFIEIDAILFPYDPNHQTFINIYEGRQLEHQAILDARTNRLTYYTAGRPGPLGRRAHVREVRRSPHLDRARSHLVFARAVAARGVGVAPRDHCHVVHARTQHHLVARRARSSFRSRRALVEPAIALSIVVVGVDNLLIAQARASAPRGGARPAVLARGGFRADPRFWFRGCTVGARLAPRSARLVACRVQRRRGARPAGDRRVVVVLLAALRRYDVVLAERFALVGSRGSDRNRALLVRATRLVRRRIKASWGNKK